MVKIFALLLAAAVGCSSGDGTGSSGSGTGGTGGSGQPGADGLDPSVQRVKVSGTLVDFTTTKAVATAATMLTNGMLPAPPVTMTGADYVVEGIPPYSVFYLVGSGMGYKTTYSVPVVVDTSDLTGFNPSLVPEQYLTDLAKAFAVTPKAGTGVVFVQAVDGMNAPKAGVPKAAFVLTGATGPFFLGADLKAAPMATATSSSGWAVFFDVAPGTASITAAAGSGYAFNASAPTEANAVSLAVVAATGAGTGTGGMTGGGTGGTGTGTPVATPSFSKDVVPIFTNRGCVNCHSANGPGKDLGGLALNGGIQHVYDGVVTQISPNYKTTRVDLKTPENSLVLKLPLYENPPDAHPVSVFPTNADKDYVTILNWIKQGAKLN